MNRIASQINQHSFFLFCHELIFLSRSDAQGDLRILHHLNRKVRIWTICMFFFFILLLFFVQTNKITSKICEKCRGFWNEHQKPEVFQRFFRGFSGVFQGFLILGFWSTFFVYFRCKIVQSTNNFRLRFWLETLVTLRYRCFLSLFRLLQQIIEYHALET